MDAQRECDAVYKFQSRDKPFALGGSAYYFPIVPVSLTKNLQLSDVMSGVTYLHDLRIVHGDLKGVRTAFLVHLPLINE